MCVGDLSNVVGSAQIHTGLSTSTWRGRGPGAGGFVRCLGPLPLCVVLLVQANRNDASDRALGPAAECECALGGCVDPRYNRRLSAFDSCRW